MPTFPIFLSGNVVKALSDRGWFRLRHFVLVAMGPKKEKKGKKAKEKKGADCGSRVRRPLLC